MQLHGFPSSLHSAVLAVLRPAESAVRRLIVIAARSVVVKLAPSRPMPEGRAIVKEWRSLPAPPSSSSIAEKICRSSPARPKIHQASPAHPFLRIRSPGGGLFPAPRPVVELPPPADGLVNAARLTRRLLALKLALDDLPRQARRLIRWQAEAESLAMAEVHDRRSAPAIRRATAGSPFTRSMKCLCECDGLAWEAMKPDTS